MTFRETLEAQKEQLQKQLDAVILLLNTLPNDPSGSITESKGSPETKKAGVASKFNSKSAPHEGIREGKRGDCTTTFVKAGASTEFTPAKLDAGDGEIIY